MGSRAQGHEEGRPCGMDLSIYERLLLCIIEDVALVRGAWYGLI